MGKGHEMECTVKLEVDEEVTVKLEPKESVNDSVTRVFNSIEKTKTCKEIPEELEQSDGSLTNLNEAVGCEVEVICGIANFIPVSAQTERSWVSDMEFELCDMTEMTEMDDIVSNAMEEISKYDPYRDVFRGYKAINSPTNKTEDGNKSNENISVKQKSASRTDHITLKDYVDNNTAGKGSHSHELEIDLRINEVTGEESSTPFLKSLLKNNTTCFDTKKHSVDKAGTDTENIAEISKSIGSAAPVRTTDNKSDLQGNDLNNSDFKSPTIIRNNISNACFEFSPHVSSTEVSSMTSKDINIKHIAEEVYGFESVSPEEYISQKLDSEGDLINTTDIATIAGNENSSDRLENKTANTFDTQENTVGSAETKTVKVSVPNIITIQPLDENDSSDIDVLSEQSATQDMKQVTHETEKSKRITIIESTENSEWIADKTKHTLRSFYRSLYGDAVARKVINPLKSAQHFNSANICGAPNEQFGKSIRYQSSIPSRSQSAGQYRSQGVLELNNSFQVELGSLSLEELGNLLSPASWRTSKKIRIPGEDQNSRQSAFSTPSKQTRNQPYTNMHRFQSPYKLTCRNNMSSGEKNKMPMPRAGGNQQIYSNISNGSQINLGLRRCSVPRVNNQILPIDPNRMGCNVNANTQIQQGNNNNNYDQINNGCNIRSQPNQRHQLYQKINYISPGCKINSTPFTNHHSHQITTAINQINPGCKLSSVTHEIDQMHQNSSAFSLVSPREVSDGQDQIHQYNSAFSRVSPGDMPNGQNKIHQSSPSFNGISPERSLGLMPREHGQRDLNSTGISQEGTIGPTPYRQVQNHQNGSSPNWISPGYSIGLQRNGCQQTNENSKAFNRTSPGGTRNCFPHIYSQIHNTSAIFTKNQECPMSPKNHRSSQTYQRSTNSNTTSLGCRNNTQTYQGGIDNTITNFSEFENNPLSQIADQLYYEAS